IRQEITEYLFKIRIQKEAEVSLKNNLAPAQQRVIEHRGDSAEGAKPATVRREEKKVGRNDPCPCGSGKKYKKCHGR
ncbi:MAG: hypothetical protein GWM98_05475, partial [Nitrospinaceae bacterium]|nr:hypothetical protein [Nitrospinaceae bacterium]NIR55851.1 hypothetical protein [Nitrospinaceae bacterium]NIS86304.1 hypothetical protein [Nitrospinaceae bacterium]NIT81229.1 hypothetical protein [Nitrospinaceae bacterium]NIU45343.1 hypothetical protein [Nitrospinaceae bacterium]